MNGRTPALAEIEWDPRGRARRSHRFNTQEIPRLRLLGLGLLWVLLISYETLTTGSAARWTDYLGLATVLAAYGIGGWLLLTRFYGRLGGIDLGLVFFNLDVLVFLLAISVVGPYHGWLPLFLLARVADQVYFGAGRALYFTHLITGGYAVLLWVMASTRAEPIDWSTGLATLTMLYAVGIYISLTGRTADALKRRTRKAVHRARELVVELDQQRERLEEQVAELEAAHEKLQYFEELYLLSPVAIVTIDNDHKIVTCNPAFEQLFGYELEELVQRTLSEMIGLEGSAEEMKQTIAEAEAGRLQCTTQRRRADGSVVDVEILAVPVDVDGARVGLLGLYHDISEQLRAREQAEAASRAKSEFVANMSHEIRTPMNGIIGMTELALDTDLTEEQSEYLTMVRESANSLLNLINELLDFSKVEAGRMEVHPIAFDLRQTVQAAVDTVSVAAENKGLALDVTVSPTVPSRIVSDPTRIRQMVLNLVGNAIKFTESGGVDVVVDSSAESGGECSLSLSVRDTGIGIPSDQQERVFDAFVQADGSTTRQHGGTGLGLAICKQIADLLGGRLTLESEPGVGTTIGFEFVCKVAPEAAEPIERCAHETLHGVRALVVDDNPTTRLILEQTVAGWGMQVDTAGHGLEALEKCKEAIRRQRPFELVLLDYRMPQINGFVVAETLRALASPEARTVVILLTSDGRAGDAARCRELGISAYLTKPVERGELLEAVRTALGVGPGREESLVTRHLLRENTRRLQVLVAEDNLVNQRLAVKLLEKWGHAAEVVDNGQDAVGRLAQGGIDVILMDVQMPGTNGLEATRAIRERERESCTRTPIIGVTAHAMESERRECLEAGMDAFLSKPIRAEELRRALERYAAQA